MFVFEFDQLNQCENRVINLFIFTRIHLSTTFLYCASVHVFLNLRTPQIVKVTVECHQSKAICDSFFLCIFILIQTIWTFVIIWNIFKHSKNIYFYNEYLEIHLNYYDLVHNTIRIIQVNCKHDSITYVN